MRALVFPVELSIEVIREKSEMDEPLHIIDVLGRKGNAVERNSYVRIAVPRDCAILICWPFGVAVTSLHLNDGHPEQVAQASSHGQTEAFAFWRCRCSTASVVHGFPVAAHDFDQSSGDLDPRLKL
jgi:hypothetical protein